MTRDEKGRFPKGVSGNPKGRSPKEREVQYMDALVSSVSVEDWKLIIDRAVTDAKRGDTAARKFIADYIIGAPVQKIAPTTPDGENEYMGAPAAELLDLVRKIASVSDTKD